MAIRTGSALIEQINSLTVGPGALALWWLGQMGVALKGETGTVIYIDPCLSEVGLTAEDFDPAVFERMFPPPVTPGEVTNADWVLCSHEHFDHTDPLTLGPLAAASPEARFLITGWSVDIMKEADIAVDRVTTAKAHQTLQLAEGIQLLPVPAAHYNREEDPEKGDRWLGFLLTWNGIRLYHAGDTIIYPGYLELIKSLAPVDIAILPTNGRDGVRDKDNIVGNLWPKEALYIADLLEAQVLIPGHNDMYRGNRIPAALFLEEWERMGAQQRFRLLQPGELLYYQS